MNAATNSEIFEETSFAPSEGTELYQYIVVPDNGVDAFNVANQPSYCDALIVIIFGLGILCGLFFGWLSSWRN